MNNILIIQTILFVILAVTQFLIALAVWISTNNRRDRWILTGLVGLAGLSNLTLVLYIAEVTPIGQLWLNLRFMLNLTNAILALVFAINVLRRNWLPNWLLQIFVVLMMIPVIGLILDLSGNSQAWFGQLLIGAVPSSSSLDILDLITIINYATGPIGVVSALISRLALVVGMVICLAVMVVDFRKNRQNAASAGAISVAFLVLAVSVIAGSTLPGGEWYFLAGQFIFTLMILILGIPLRNEVLSLRGIGDIIRDWPMLNKLLLVVLGIVLPGILLLSITFVLFLQITFLNNFGTDLELLARSQAAFVHDELVDETDKLRNLAADRFIQSLLNSREATYAPLTQEQIFEQLQQGEIIWQQGQESNEFVNTLLSSARNAQFNEFRREYPEHTTLILTDSHGALVSSTEYVELFDWSRSLWWEIVTQNAFPYIGFYQTTDDRIYLEIAVPVNTDNDLTEVEGVLLSRYDFTETMAALYRFEQSADVELAMFQADWVWVAPPRNVLRLSDPQIDNVLLESQPGQNWQLMPYGNENSIVAFAGIQRDIAQIGNITWRVVAYTPAETALSPVANARWGALALGGGLLLLSVITTFLISGLIVRPLTELTSVAQRIEGGERDLDFPITSKDEIGILGSSFQTMIQELNRVVTNLEASVADRTVALQRRALQLETSSLVAREAASIRELETLLNSVTSLITDRFGFYHTGIFLLDDEREYAVLRAANSPGGQRMLARGHKLQVGKIGVVGYAAGEGVPRLAQDVGADVVYYDNPEMPDTRSELALPMRIRDQVIGVLDVQSTNANAFSPEDVEILENLTDQIALAIDNARLLEGSQRALSELQYLYGQRAAQAWRSRLANDPLELYYDISGFRSDPPPLDTNRVSGPIMRQDIIFRGQVIGTIELERDIPSLTWTAEEQTLVSEIIEQTALALENARLVDQIRLRSDQIQLLQEITALSASLKEESNLLNEVAHKLQDGLGLYFASVMLVDNKKNESRIAAIANASGTRGLDHLLKERYPVKNNQILETVIKDQETLLIPNIQSDKRVSTSYYQYYHTIPTLVIAPLIARGEVIGTLELGLIDPDRRLDEEELNLLEQISVQVATALDSSRLFTQTASRAERERLVAEITTKVRASNDPGTIIETAVRELRLALNAKHAQIRLDGEPTNGTSQSNSNSRMENGNQEHDNAESQHSPDAGYQDQETETRRSSEQDDEDIS